MRNYILEGRTLVEAPIEEWSWWFENAARRGRNVVAQELIDGRLVSTVFLGLDHRFPIGAPGEPLIFETMVFDGQSTDSNALFQCRWSTYAEAESGHSYTAALVRAHKAPFLRLIEPSDTGEDA